MGHLGYRHVLAGTVAACMLGFVPASSLSAPEPSAPDPAGSAQLLTARSGPEVRSAEPVRTAQAPAVTPPAPAVNGDPCLLGIIGPGCSDDDPDDGDDRDDDATEDGTEPGGGAGTPGGAVADTGGPVDTRGGGTSGGEVTSGDVAPGEGPQPGCNPCSWPQEPPPMPESDLAEQVEAGEDVGTSSAEPPEVVIDEPPESYESPPPPPGSRPIDGS